jgi:phytoene synthase
MTEAMVQASRAAIEKGSKSFAAAARLFDARTRDDASMLYAWCRHCDDEIDGQTMGHGQTRLDPALAAARLRALQDQTRAALAGTPSDDPVFEAFRQVATRHAIPAEYPLALLEGFAMDVAGQRYRSLEDVRRYAWHVAGVVGVMMAMVMGVRDLPTLRRAADLGIALQLTNIARDVIEDAQAGRVYLPEDWLAEAGLTPADILDPGRRAILHGVACRLLDEADRYYASARWGLRALPFRSAWAIAAARGVYRRIGTEVARSDPAGWGARAVVGGGRKRWLALQGGLVALRAVTLDRVRKLPARPPLWSPL